MPSPDLRPYVDLTIYDRSPTQLVDRALLDAQVKMPGWTPRHGNTEVTLIESISLVVSELIYAINRLPAATVEVLLRLFNITRLVGSKPTATATFTLADTLGHTIPAGTRVRLDLGSGKSEVFTTNAAATAAPGVSTITTAITGQDNTDAANGVVSGTALALIDAVMFVNTVALGATVAGGALPEGDVDWLTRGAQSLSALVTTLVLPSHFIVAAPKLDTNVYRVTAIDQWDSTLAGGAGGAANGHITVAVLGKGNVALPGAEMTTLATNLKAQAQSNLAVHVIAPTVTAVNVTATVFQLPGYGAGVVQANVVAALQAFLSTDIWPWTPVVRLNDLLAVLKTVTGVSYVVAMSAPAADIILPGAAALTTPGTLTITVNGP